LILNHLQKQAPARRRNYLVIKHLQKTFDTHHNL